MLRDEKRRLGCYTLLALIAVVIAILLVIDSEGGPKRPINVMTPYGELNGRARHYSTAAGVLALAIVGRPR